jgi:hypothetical protein
MNLANLLCVFTGRYNDPANSNNKADNGSPSVDELLAFLNKGILTVFQNSIDTP